MTNFTPHFQPLLKALQWKGTDRAMAEAMPIKDVTDLQTFRDTMARLGFDSHIRIIPVVDIQAGHLPAIYIDDTNTAHLLLTENDLANLSIHTVTLISFGTLPAREEGDAASVGQIMRRFNPLLRQIFLISIVIGVVALAPILYNRGIYDHIIASGSTVGMGMLITGVILALATEMALRVYRNNRLAFFGGRLDHFISCSVFERLLFLPPLYTERASVSAQLARLRDFESVREFFTGPLATLFFELPLIAVYFLVMIVMTGWLSLVPLALFFCYALLIFIMTGRLKRHSRASSNASTQRQEFLLETVTKLRAIRLAGLEDVWQERYRSLSSKASYTSFRSAFTAQTLETISYVLMTLGGIATLTFGVIAVLGQSLTVGALIAAMMLVWRVIAPLQICCASITRLQQLASSSKQVQRVLAVAPEHDPYAPSLPQLKLKGGLTFHRVSLRYSSDSEPALLGVSFEIKPGQIVAIKGNNGSGKSSILKLILGMYQPQSGSIRLDGVDMRQFDPLAVRQSISYIPQSVDLFPGTIRKNILFCEPSADENTIIQALKDSCAWEEIQRMPFGLDTVIEGDGAIGISYMLRQRINLARAYVKKSSLMLFDEASYSLGQDNDDSFKVKIAALRGKSTVLLVTHREDHMLLADILLVMNKGELTHAGPPEQVLTVLRGKKS